MSPETDTQRVALSGLTWQWLQWNTSWGNTEGEDQASREARTAILAAPSRRIGATGRQYTADLTPAQAESLWGILDSIAAAGETMTAEERGDDASTYRAIRRDATRLRQSQVG